MTDREQIARLPGPQPFDHTVPLDEIHLVHRVVDESRVDMHFQPIVNLRDRKVFAYEALCRPQSSDFKSPERLISAAVRAGRIGELGRILRAAAVKSCPDWPIFLNIEPNEFDQGWLVRPDDSVFRHRWPVYLEITETAPISFFEQCHSVLGELRKKGALLAIDDLGAGYSNLQYIAELKPDIVKLDRELVNRVCRGSREFGLLRSITRLCHEMGAKVVAEGVETTEEFEAVLRAEVDYCQGFLLARPASPPPEVTWPDVQRVAPAPKRIDPPPAEGTVPKEPVAHGPAATGSRPAASSRKVIEDLSRQLQGLRDSLAKSEEQRRALFLRLQVLSPDAADVGGKPVATVSSPDPPSDSRRAPSEGQSVSRGRPTPQAPAVRRWRIPLAAAVPVSFLLGALVVMLLRVGGNLQAPAAALASQPTPVRSTSPRAPGKDVESTKVPAAPVDLPHADAGSGEEPAVDSAETVHLRAVSQIEARVGAWARAWMEHRSEDYLSFYSRDFQPAGGMAREVWEEQRLERVGRPGPISVSVDEPMVSLAGGESAQVTFRQSYESKTYRDQVIKTLALVREDGEWRIAEERVETP